MKKIYDLNSNLFIFREFGAILSGWGRDRLFRKGHGA